MISESVIRFCSPTLAGMKTGSLFNMPYENKRQVLAFVGWFNRNLSSKGIEMRVLRFSENKCLVYVFRPDMLRKDLSRHFSMMILTSQGYDKYDMEECINTLSQKLRNKKEFPHEIGLFLGYPPEDVQGFICNKGKCSKCTGCWKVYGDIDKALSVFRKYKKCSQVYYSKWLNGFSLRKLTVST